MREGEGHKMQFNDSCRKERLGLLSNVLLATILVIFTARKLYQRDYTVQPLLWDDCKETISLSPTISKFDR